MENINMIYDLTTMLHKLPMYFSKKRFVHVHDTHFVVSWLKAFLPFLHLFTSAVFFAQVLLFWGLLKPGLYVLEALLKWGSFI